MSERTYGIPLSHVQGSQQTRTPESPGEAMGYTSHSGHDYRDAGNPYDSRMNTHSPGPYHDAYGPPSPPPHMHGPVSPIHQESQTSLAPLTENQALGYSPSVSTNRSFQRNAPAMPAGAGAGLGAAGYGQSLPRLHSYYGDEYDSFDPSTIEDDGDDGIPAGSRSRNKLGFGAAAGAGAGAGVGMKAMDRGSSGLYGPVGNDAEKSEWLSKQTDRSSRKKKWIIGCTIAAILVIGGIVGGVVGGILANNKDENERGSSGGSSTVGSDSAGLYDLNSRQVQAVLNDDRLHRVFPTIDYTPWYAQYPACLSPGGGPTQNNVTLDIARLSQLAASVRLYGTDCNQTELVLEAIERLEMQDTMKVWLGVYLDGRNQTTNDRQLKDLYRILDNYPHDRFVGVIVGNEVLFQETMTVTELAAQLDEVRSNFSSRGINLPVATADLGDNWDADLAKASDIVMSNIHPFFAGTVAEDAAGWAWSFWQNKDVALTSSKTGTIGSVTYPKQIISEIGWPTQGGNDCGVSSDPAFGCKSETDGAVASIENLNTFMDGWVCEALKNGTTFFWFEAFDEPWKHQFDTEHNKWEPYWGIFDKDRNLKKGIKIPDCGTSVAKPY